MTSWPWRIKCIPITFQFSQPTSQQTHSFFITKMNELWFRKINLYFARIIRDKSHEEVQSSLMLTSRHFIHSKQLWRSYTERQHFEVYCVQPNTNLFSVLWLKNWELQTNILQQYCTSMYRCKFNVTLNFYLHIEVCSIDFKHNVTQKYSDSFPFSASGNNTVNRSFSVVSYSRVYLSFVNCSIKQRNTVLDILHFEFPLGINSGQFFNGKAVGEKVEGVAASTKYPLLS